MDPELRRRLLKILLLKLLLRYKRQLKHCTSEESVNTSLTTGSDFIHNDILRASPVVCFDLLRMNKEAFINMCALFRERGWLANSRYLSVEEKMAMFLLTIGQNLRNRFVKQRFQHSGETVHRYFHEVLHAMLLFSKEMIIPPSFHQPSTEISNHRQLRQIFKGAIGAIDGMLIHARIPIDKQLPYRVRGKGECYQNVMAMCDFDMIFMYVQAGWEGIADDSRVLQETIRNPANNFPIPPPGKYYLVDAAYTLTQGFLSPFHNVRYWLRDFCTGGHPRGREEVFNHAHAKLRNVIERAFGVLKARFPILTRMAPYTFPTQRNIVIACMAIHNYLRKVAFADRLFNEYDDEDVNLEEPNEQEHEVEDGGIFGHAEQAFMFNFREQIANEFFQANV